MNKMGNFVKNKKNFKNLFLLENTKRVHIIYIIKLLLVKTLGLL